MSLRVAFGDDLTFDLVLDAGARRFQVDDGLETAVALSLFTDRRASDAELQQFGWEPNENRGWPGDTFPEVDGDRWGSALWLLERALRNDDALSFAKQFAEEALAWLLADDVAAQVTVATAWIGRSGYLQLDIEITRTNGVRWRSEWDATTGQLLRAA